MLLHKMQTVLLLKLRTLSQHQYQQHQQQQHQ